MLAILEYKAGNQTSVRRALEHLGIPCRITADPAELEQAQGIIFPGVGAAGQAMEALTSAGLDSVLRRAVAEASPCWASAWAARSCWNTARRTICAPWASCPAAACVFPTI